jgi:hypothetical protein
MIFEPIGKMILDSTASILWELLGHKKSLSEKALIRADDVKGFREAQKD